VAEDDDPTRELLAKILRREGYTVVEVVDGAEAIERLGDAKFDLVLSDIQMPRVSGLDILAAVTHASPDTPVVLITAYAEPGAAMDAIAQGAAEYLAKPIDVVALRTSVARALERSRLRGENRQLRDQVAGQNTLIGTSAPMLALYKQIAQVAPTDATVLITGESGTGKEVVARTIHQRSRRAKGPYHAVNCSALAESLLESELFGHEKGAFTGAQATRRGFFEEAAGGTLLLDEIGDVPPKMQAQLLRVLQEGELRRVGGSASIRIDVRIVSATNRDLAQDVAEKRMRSDLYYRLNVVSLAVPPLRERGDDVVALTRYFVGRLALQFGRPVPDISDEAMRCIRTFPWPGNVRELENALARAVAMAQRDILLPADLPSLISGAKADADPPIDHDWPTVDRLRHRYIERVLRQTGGNKTAAANILGVDRRTLQRMNSNEDTSNGDGDGPTK
jgi:DNA-binding NtrC family response regulator